MDNFALSLLMLALLLAALASFPWSPARGAWLLAGLRAGAWACSLSCGLSLLLAALAPGNHRLAIYALALNLLITPTWATLALIRELRAASAPAAKGPDFAQVLAEAAGTQHPLCEEPEHQETTEQ